MSRAQLTSTVEQNTGGAVAPYVAGKNKIINGDFGIWARGTSFTVTGTESVVYKADRWSIQADGSTTTRTISQQTFDYSASPAADKLPITGYPSTYFLRYAQTIAGNNSYNYLTTRLENVTTYAGQTVTLSFWAKADAARTVSTYISQNFGSGGSGSVSSISQNNSLTTSWQRFTFTVTLASISGKTIGTSSFVEPTFQLPSGAITPTIDIWGVQLETGSVATPFTTATGTLSGELTACQRYYQRVTPLQNTSPIGLGYATTTTVATIFYPLKSTMRTTPSAVDFTILSLWDQVNVSIGISSMTLNTVGPDNVSVNATVASGLTAFRPYVIIGGTSSYLGITAEL